MTGYINKHNNRKFDNKKTITMSPRVNDKQLIIKYGKKLKA